MRSMPGVAISSLEKESGFTFVELLITLAILGVMAMIAVPYVRIDAQRARETELRSALIQIREGLDSYKRAVDQGRIPVNPGSSGYPPSLDELWKGVTDQRSPTQQKIYFLRRLPGDPMNVNDQGPASKSWGLRSYASSNENPVEGADVFDVYSRSPRTGLNGVPYREW